MMTVPSPAIGTKYPLLFTFRDTLFGNGFVVEVQASNGRALCVHEDDQYWVYGINPGGVSVCGDDPEAARAAFRQTFSNVLVDLALVSNSIEQFRSSVDQFFNETNDGYVPDWQEAVGFVQRGQVTLAGVPLAPANSQRSITVSLKPVENIRAQDNSSSLQYLLAA